MQQDKKWLELLAQCVTKEAEALNISPSAVSKEMGLSSGYLQKVIRSGTISEVLLQSVVDRWPVLSHKPPAVTVVFTENTERSAAKDVAFESARLALDLQRFTQKYGGKGHADLLRRAMKLSLSIEEVLVIIDMSEPAR